VTDQQILDADVVEDTPSESETARALAAPTRPAPLSVTPQVGATELVARLAVIKDAMTNAMVDGVDYGKVPGTDKPTLLKPGAEKLGVLFQLDVQLTNEKHWNGDHLTVSSTATVYHIPTGARLGFGEGMCSTRERKYAYRKQQRQCPSCGAAAVIKGKAEFGGGWLCWKKKDGCGAKFSDGDAAIEQQPVGEIENPDLPDVWNTVVKMAEKRARVDAVLAVTGASALFTQDAEDLKPAAGEPEPAEPERGHDETIDPAWAARLQDLFRSKHLNLKDAREHLAAVGVSQALALTKQGIEKALGRLSPAQATTLEGRLS
jgi:hypothetical protein